MHKFGSFLLHEFAWSAVAEIKDMIKVTQKRQVYLTF